MHACVHQACFRHAHGQAAQRGGTWRWGQTMERSPHVRSQHPARPASRPPPPGQARPAHACMPRRSGKPRQACPARAGPAGLHPAQKPGNQQLTHGGWLPPVGASSGAAAPPLPPPYVRANPGTLRAHASMRGPGAHSASRKGRPHTIQYYHLPRPCLYSTCTEAPEPPRSDSAVAKGIPSKCAPDNRSRLHRPLPLCQPQRAAAAKPLPPPGINAGAPPPHTTHTPRSTAGRGIAVTHTHYAPLSPPRPAAKAGRMSGSIIPGVIKG